MLIVIKAICRRYWKYGLYFDPTIKTLYIRKPIPVADYLNIKNIIRDYQLEISVRVGYRGNE